MNRSLVAAALIVFCFCPGVESTAGPPGNPTQPVEAAVGEDFSVTLASNPTTGYHWELAAPLDEAVVKLVGSDYRPPDSKLIGAGGLEIWTFRAAGKGETVIRMKYVRPWEKDVPPVKTAEFTVRVR